MSADELPTRIRTSPSANSIVLGDIEQENAGNRRRAIDLGEFFACELIFISYFSSTMAASHGGRTSDWPGVMVACESRLVPNA